MVSIYSERHQLDGTNLLPLFEFVQVLDSVVRDSDALDLTCVYCFDKSLPSTVPAICASIWRMNKVEVDVVQPRVSKLNVSNVSYKCNLGNS